MKRKYYTLKQMIALLLAIGLTFGAACFTAPSAEAASWQGSDFTTGKLAERLDSIINTGIGADVVSPSFGALGSTFSSSSWYKDTSPEYSHTSMQCMAYARAAYIFLFEHDIYHYAYKNDLSRNFAGKESLSYEIMRDANVRFGAYVRTGYYNSNGGYVDGHSFLILKYDESGIYVLEAISKNSSEYCTRIRYSSWSDFNKNYLGETTRNGQRVVSRMANVVQPDDTLYASLTGDDTPPPPPEPPISDGIYTFTPQCAPNSRLDIKGASTADKANAQIYQSNNSKAQQFEITSAGDGYYTITCVASGKALDVSGGKRVSGTNVWQYTANGTDAQKWAFIKLDDGYYRIVSKLDSSLSLDVNGKRSANGTNVQIWSNNTSTAQKWKLTLLAAAPAKYTLTFDAQGGSVSPSSVTFTYGVPLSSLPTPTRSGYTFKGWLTNLSGPAMMATPENAVYFKEDTTLYAFWAENEEPKSEPHWSDWSSWSDTPVTASSTRQVETRQVEITPAHTEYRYGRYVDPVSGKARWCATWLNSRPGVSGQVQTQYSSWSTTQYSTGKTDWSCGFCSGDHSHAHHYSSDGRAWWKEYLLPNNQSYYWEESRTVQATYKTQYRYRDWVTN